MEKILVSPSILSADFCDMKVALKEIEHAGADWVHCDVMDGVFVPNISFGQKMISDVNSHTDMILDVHLMIVQPEKYVKEFVKNGADFLTIHLESSEHVLETLKLIRDCGAKAGLSIKPATDVEAVRDYLDFVDLILVMSVEPGFGGQKFQAEALKKISLLKEMTKGKDVLVEVDGGVTADNVVEIISAGADVVVAGSSFFSAKDKSEIVKRLRGQL